jgi:elongation factor G
MSTVQGFRPQDLRNVVLLGHGGVGKTTLAETMLYRCGAIVRMGSVDDANTTSDYEPEAKAHRHSTNSSVLFANREKRELNLVDTPGHPDFVGFALASLPAVETALIVVNAATGIEFNTRRLFHAAGEAGLARMVVVNKIDTAPGRLAQLVVDLKETFGATLHCLNLPTKFGTDVVDCFDQDAGRADFGSVAEVHRELLESTVEIDDAELERYLAGETIPLDRLRADFIRAMTSGHVVPILFASAKTGVGIDDLLHVLVEEAPSPMSGRARRLRVDGVVREVACDPSKPFIGHVFKVTHDDHLGQVALVRILQGSLDAETSLVCSANRQPRKAGHVLKVEGRAYPELKTAALAGDIVGLAKLDAVHVNQLIHEAEVEGELTADLPTYPVPMISLALEVRVRVDEAKFGRALQALRDEDPTFRFERNPSTHELVASGLGELHLRVSLEKLKSRFNLDLVAKEPTIAYRETVTERSEGHARHKKQSGGSGQFGEVFLRLEPLPRGAGVQFASEVFGGAIPAHYLSSVERGVQDALSIGSLAGFPVTDVRVIVTDGKSHPVDSKEVAFRSAGRLATRDALGKAHPVLLEPIVRIEVTAPEGAVGDVTGHIKLHHGRVFTVDMVSPTVAVIRAQLPLAELGAFTPQLRGLTSGQGSFVMEFSHHELVSEAVQQRLVSRKRPPLDEELAGA